MSYTTHAIHLFLNSQGFGEAEKVESSAAEPVVYYQKGDVRYKVDYHYLKAEKRLSNAGKWEPEKADSKQLFEKLTNKSF
jgi:hypothetical protein